MRGCSQHVILLVWADNGKGPVAEPGDPTICLDVSVTSRMGEASVPVPTPFPRSLNPN